MIAPAAMCRNQSRDCNPLWMRSALRSLHAGHDGTRTIPGASAVGNAGYLGSWRKNGVTEVEEMRPRLFPTAYPSRAPKRAGHKLEVSAEKITPYQHIVVESHVSAERPAGTMGNTPCTTANCISACSSRWASKRTTVLDFSIKQAPRRPRAGGNRSHRSRHRANQHEPNAAVSLSRVGVGLDGTDVSATASPPSLRPASRHWSLRAETARQCLQHPRIRTSRCRDARRVRCMPRPFTRANTRPIIAIASRNPSSVL